VESHNRAERATQAGYFKDQIVPVTLKSKKGDVQYATDEHFRPGATMEDMAKLKPVFVKENGTVTAGNASGINDAAAAVVLMEAGRRQGARRQAAGPPGGLRPRGRGPQIHGHWPRARHAAGAEKGRPHGQRPGRDRSQRSLRRPGLRRDQRPGLDPAKVNPNGSGISLGHPIGATGALITVKACTSCNASRAATRW
jgi:acetyl-CoA C-acetyltransferase